MHGSAPQGLHASNDVPGSRSVASDHPPLEPDSPSPVDPPEGRAGGGGPRRRQRTSSNADQDDEGGGSGTAASHLRRSSEGVSPADGKPSREQLWSYLFHNVNRAVDELYALCEAEVQGPRLLVHSAGCVW